MLNQSHGHWLFFNALHIIITTTLKLKEEFRISTSTLMDDDYVIALEFSFFTFNIQKKSGVLDRFLSFCKKFEKNKTHTMLSLMLDLKSKDLWLVSSIIGQE